MEHLVGNFWIHDPGTGEVSLYERIGRNYRPIRAESEPLPDRIPAEAQAVIRQRLEAAAVTLNARTPKEVRLARLTDALKLFPKFHELPKEEQDAFLEHMSDGLPESFEETKPETQGLEVPPTVEAQVEAANRKRAEEIDRVAFAQTELLRQSERTAALEAELAALRSQLNKPAPAKPAKKKTNGKAKKS